MRLLKWLGGLLTRNLGWKLLSLGIAVVLWALVASEPELSTFAVVGVEYKNLPDGLEISTDLVSSLRLELRGPSGALRGLGEGGTRPEVILDMSGVEPGERTFEIGEGNVKLPRGVCWWGRSRRPCGSASNAARRARCRSGRASRTKGTDTK